MAEFVMKYLLANNGMSDTVSVASAGCDAAIGDSISNGAESVLLENHIPFSARQATQFTPDMYDTFDYIVAMDKDNMEDICQMCGGDPQKKVTLLMEFAGVEREVSDPFVTGDYPKTCEDIMLGCKGILQKLKVAK